MQDNKKNVGILGYGEIGKAVASFFESAAARGVRWHVKIKDLTRDDGLAGVEVLHVCIPWNDQFVETVKREIAQIQPRLTIIHSTVVPGTTKAIGGMTVHSPVRGIHPHLHEGMKMFVKYVGADAAAAGTAAKEQLESLGMKTKVVMPAATTELGKLLSTTYYGMCIAWHGEMKRFCDELGVDFDKAVTDFNETYNEGYTQLGKKNVVRPTLYPPEDGIRGHCILPNVHLLQEQFQSAVLDFILKYQPRSNEPNT